MRYIHNFGTVSAFTEEYTGSGYTEPWVSYTKENQKVDYNYVPEVTLVNTWSWWDETTGDEVSTSATITLKNLEISCSDLWAFSEAGKPDGGSCSLSITVEDKGGNQIYYGGGPRYPSGYDTMTDCEKCGYYYNEHEISDDEYMYDIANGKFIPLLDGCTITLYWDTWK